MIDIAPTFLEKILVKTPTMKTLTMQIFSKCDLTDPMKIALVDRKCDDLAALAEEEAFHGMHRGMFEVPYDTGEERQALLNIFGQAFDAGWSPVDIVVLMDDGEVSWIVER
jgi:hypothetical protein